MRGREQVVALQRARGLGQPAARPDHHRPVAKVQQAERLGMGGVREGDHQRAAARGRLLLRATLRVYHALYTTGVLQRSVLVRHGRKLEPLPVDWALPGDPHLWSVLNEAEETGRPVAFVIGKLPPGLDLFATARYGTYLSKDRWTVTLLEGGAPVALPREKILAARLA